MDFELQPPQARLRDLARQVAHDHLAAYAATVDRDAVFPADSIAAVRAAGLLDLLTPTHYGGGAVDWQTFVHGWNPLICAPWNRRSHHGMPAWRSWPLHLLSCTD